MSESSPAPIGLLGLGLGSGDIARGVARAGRGCALDADRLGRSEARLLPPGVKNFFARVTGQPHGKIPGKSSTLSSKL